MGKLKHQITVNLDDDGAQLVQALAKYYNRKPAELVRLLITPALRSEWVEVQKIEHPENRQPWKVAKFEQ